MIIIDGKSRLQPWYRAWAFVEGEIDRLPIVGVFEVLCWVRSKQISAAIAHHDYVVESKIGRGNLAADRRTNFLKRQKASRVIESVHKWTVDCRLKPRSSVECSVVVADGREIAPDRKVEVVIVLVL